MKATIKACGHKRIDGYFEQNKEGEDTGRVICKFCYNKKDNWLNKVIKIKEVK